MIKLGKMTVENFLSIGPKVELDFGSHKGVNYIFGTNKDVEGTRNGCGKSSLFDATQFALFGETSRKVGNKFIAHRQMPGKDTLVTLHLENDKGRYYIEAGLKRGSGFFKLFADSEHGEMLNKSSIKETRAYFEREILGMDYLVAKSSFFLTSGESNFLTMKKDQKRSYVESIFKLGVFGEMLKKTRVDLNALDKEIAIVQDSIRRLNVDIKGFEDKEAEFVKTVKEKIAICDGDLAKLMETKPILDSKLARLREVMSSLPEVPVIPDVKIPDAPPFSPPCPYTPYPAFVEPAPFVPPVVNVESVPVPTRKDYSEVFKKLDAAKGKVMAAKAEADGNIANYDRNVRKCENILNAVCSDCKPIISKMYDVKDSSYIEEQKAILSKCASNLDELNSKYLQIEDMRKKEDEDIRKIESVFQEAKNKAEDEIRSAKFKYDDEVRKARMVHEEMALADRRKYDDNYRELKRRYDDEVLESRRKAEEAILEARRKALAIEADRNKVESAMKEVEGTIRGLETSIRVVEEKKSELAGSGSPYKQLIEEYQSKLEDRNEDMARFCRKRKLLDIITTIVGEDGVKKHILNDIVEIVNNRVQKYLYETGSSFTCVFDGGFNCEFITETGPASYENFSSGEKARINLSILLTFRDILLTMGFPKMNVLVVDELIDSNLDSYAVNAVAAVLKRVTSTENLSAYLISHRECFDDGLFEKVMEVVKHGGFTSLIEDSKRI